MLLASFSAMTNADVATFAPVVVIAEAPVALILLDFDGYVDPARLMLRSSMTRLPLYTRGVGGWLPPAGG